MATRLGNFVAYALLAAIAGVALGLLSVAFYPPTNSPKDSADPFILHRPLHHHVPSERA